MRGVITALRRRLLWRLLLAGCLSWTGGAAQQTAPPGPIALNSVDRSALEQALAACDRGDGQGQRQVLQRLAAKHPGNYAANEALGIVLIDAGDAPGALVYLKRAAAAKPADAASAANLGAAYLAVGDPRAAVNALQRAAALDPKNAATRSTLGQALLKNRQAKEAAEAFTVAAKLDPANVDLAYNAAVVLFDLHKDGAVVEALSRVPPEQRSDAVESLWGDAEERQGHFEQAIEHLQNAARLNPAEPAVYAVAIELLRHWSWEPAGKMAQFGLARFPESRRLRLAQGIAAYGAGQYLAAAATFGALLALDPGNTEYGLLLGRSCAATGGAAAPQCSSLVAFAEAHPANPAINVSAAVSLLHGEQPETHLDQAERLLRRAIMEDPGASEAFYQLGVLQQERLQWIESAASLGTAVRLRPAFAEAHYRLSRAYSHLGDAEGARREIALQQRFSQQEKDESVKRLHEVTTFLIASH